MSLPERLKYMSDREKWVWNETAAAMQEEYESGEMALEAFKYALENNLDWDASVWMPKTSEKQSFTCINKIVLTLCRHYFDKLFYKK